MMGMDQGIGKRIKKARESANMTQAELAEKISSLRETVAYYETGQRDIKTGTLIRLAKTLGVSADYLLGLPVSLSVDYQRKVKKERYIEIVRDEMYDKLDDVMFEIDQMLELYGEDWLLE